MFVRINPSSWHYYTGFLVSSFQDIGSLFRVALKVDRTDHGIIKYSYLVHGFTGAVVNGNSYQAPLFRDEELWPEVLVLKGSMYRWFASIEVTEVEPDNRVAAQMLLKR